MFKGFLKATVLTAGLAFAGSAQAASVTIEFTHVADVPTGVSQMNTFLSGAPLVVTEDFEGFTSYEACMYVADCTYDTAGTISSGSGLSTNVGTFGTILPEGTGSSSVTPQDKAIIRSATPGATMFGRYDADPDIPGELDRNNYLDSNDNTGIALSIAPGTLGMFDRIAMLLTDVDDVGSALFSVTASGQQFTTAVFNNTTGYGNGKLFLLTFLFHQNVDSALIDMQIDRGDGFGVDYTGVGVVPLPAPAFLLLGGLAGLAAFRRKRATA